MGLFVYSNIEPAFYSDSQVQFVRAGRVRYCCRDLLKQRLLIDAPYPLSEQSALTKGIATFE